MSLSVQSCSLPIPAKRDYSQETCVILNVMVFRFSDKCSPIVTMKTVHDAVVASSYLPDETARIRTWNPPRLSQRIANRRPRCSDTVPKATSSCRPWRTASLRGTRRRRSTATRCITPEAVLTRGQGKLSDETRTIL